jgi:hypothetical protein
MWTNADGREGVAGAVGRERAGGVVNAAGRHVDAAAEGDVREVEAAALRLAGAGRADQDRAENDQDAERRSH